MDISLLFSQYVHAIGAWAYPLILLISFGESLIFTGLFVPGTVLVVLSGGLAAHGLLHLSLLIVAATCGAIVGDSLSYELGRRGRMHFNSSKYFGRHITRTQVFFRSHQRKSVILGRFIGPLRPFIPFIAGASDMPRGFYYPMCVISGVSWSVLYVGIGYVFGAAWKAALMWSSRAAVIVVIGIILCMLFMRYWRKMTEN